MKTKLLKWVRNLHEDCQGAMSVEKILILGLIAVPILVLLLKFRTTIMGWFTTQQQDLTNNQ